MPTALLILWLITPDHTRTVEIKYRTMAECTAAREMIDMKRLEGTKSYLPWKEIFALCVPTE